MVKTKINININKDDSELNDFLHCWGKFGSRPNKIIMYNSFSKEEFITIIKEYTSEKNVFTEIIPAEESHIINDKVIVMINENLYLSYLLLDSHNEKSLIHEITFLFKEYEKELPLIDEIVKKLEECVIDFCDDEDVKLNTVTIGQSGLEIEPIELRNIDSENIELYYSSTTFKSVEKITKLIKKSEKGLSIFYGPRGTGKTSIIDYISDKLDRIVIFIPNNLIEVTINNPEFKRFLMKHPRPILVIDDCEVLLNDYFNKSNIITNNILQLVDGFLSDSIGVNIITIFNIDDEEEIDHSLLDCNNLVDIIEFELLDEDESNELSKQIGSKKKYKNKTRLIDIIRKKPCVENKKIGF